MVSILNMSILYKYCNQLGAKKILKTLELKLPYISGVNDPLECSPIFDCSDDVATIEICLSRLEKLHFRLPSDYKTKITETSGRNEIKEWIIEKHRKIQNDWKRKACLLSVSEVAQNTVMWSHYADKHKGVVIGIDFDEIFLGGIVMQSVNYPDYSKQRTRVDVARSDQIDAFITALVTKSKDWGYEKELRTVFSVDDLERLQKQKHACLRGFFRKKAWFLRLSPVSIKEVVFGLYAEKRLKSAIRRLIARPELQHVKLYQASESDTYSLDLISL
jgi:hypothetical protein